ncbi:MAG: nucleoside-binding protein [Aestuariibacter sp.]
MTTLFWRALMLWSLILPATEAKQLWTDPSFSLLRGENYQLGDSDRTIVTFEHASGHDWGDTFLFIDRLESSNGFTETYGEFTLRYGIKEWPEQFIKKLSLAGSTEVGDGFTNYLYGFGLDLDIPGFRYFQANFYLRNNEFAERTEQLTLVFAIPLGPLLWDGFIDFAGSGKNDLGQPFTASPNFTSQLKYDLGPSLGLSSRLYAGVEYVYWQDKFGVQGIDERNVNLLLKWHF